MIVTADTINIEHAAKLLRAGKVVGFPTETVYGLGASAFDSTAVSEVFRLKGRPATNPLIVHLANMQQIHTVADISKSPWAAQRLERLARFWPGPLTVILPVQPVVSPLVTGGGNTIGVRIPAHPVAKQLLELAQLPVAAPSANISFGVSATTAQHVLRDFGENLELILDGGPCSVGLESTVLHVSAERAQLLRPGATTMAELENALQEEILAPLDSPQRPTSLLAHKSSEVSPAISPGTAALHYAPKTPLMLLSEFEGAQSGGTFARARNNHKFGLISFSRTCTELNRERFQVITTVSQRGDPAEIGVNLFSALRELDTQQLDLIVVDSGGDSGPEHGLWHAIMDRVRRARHA